MIKLNEKNDLQNRFFSGIGFGYIAMIIGIYLLRFFFKGLSSFLGGLCGCCCGGGKNKTQIATSTEGASIKAIDILCEFKLAWLNSFYIRCINEEDEANETEFCNEDAPLKEELLEKLKKKKVSIENIIERHYKKLEYSSV